MIVLPTLRHLRIENYGLFPGDPVGTGIDFQINPGVSLVAGINGLGKTTLLTVFLRLLTGPYDLAGSGLPAQVDSVTPEEPVRLKAETLRFFSQRVADGARDSSATLSVSFQDNQLVIRRELKTLKLVDLQMNGRSIIDKADPDHGYQKLISRLMNLSSFVDVLLVLHYIVFFPENRPGALWDLNAQRHLLRAVLLPKSAASSVASLERKVGSADSLVRNLGYALTIQKKSLQAAQQLHATAPGLRAELRSVQSLLDADLERRSSLEATREEVESDRRKARLELERAKIERDDAERAVERIKFSALSSMFPTMSDVARLTILNLLSKSQCLVCGAHSDDARARLEADLATGICPVCSSPPSAQENVIPVRKVEAGRLAKAKARASLALEEETATQLRWSKLNDSYNEVIVKLKEITNRIDDLQVKERRIAGDLPTPSQELQQLELSVKQMQRDVAAAEARRAEHSADLRIALKRVQKELLRKSDQLARKYRFYCEKLLSEEAVLVQIEGDAGIAQTFERFSVPQFRTDMSAAARPGLTRRSSVLDVSESQRELIDLAFRFALIEVAAEGNSASLVIETPEASLDGIAMERVGNALYDFANSKEENRLIATTNLSNAGLIGHLFGGAARTKRERSDRWRRTIDLLRLSAKNQALLLDVAGRYSALLENALEGRDAVG